MWTDVYKKVYNVLVNNTEKTDLEGYAMIRNQIMHTGVTPSLRQIAAAVGYASPRSVQLMLKRLEDRGLLSYENGIITLSRKSTASLEKTVSIPLVGAVACGLPSLAEQDVEAYIPVSTRIAKPGHKYFLLRARGTSMNKSEISDGDLVLVREQSHASEGDKVVALIDDEATIKHFHQRRGMIVLKPRSTDSSHQPILLSEEFSIQGVVVATLPAEIY